MFGSSTDKNSQEPAKPAAPPTASPTGTTGVMDTANVTPPPPPNTTIAPADTPPQGQTAPYLETAKASDNTAFLTTGASTPKTAPDIPGMQNPAVIPPEGSDELIKLKQQALQNLAPLIDKLDQTPEERFKTLMMMIQASDNAQYLDQAYTAASGIKDEKDRARALLDVVNEINYFTTQNHKPSSST